MRRFTRQELVEIGDIFFGWFKLSDIYEWVLKELEAPVPLRPRNPATGLTTFELIDRIMKLLPNVDLQTFHTMYGDPRAYIDNVLK